MHLFIILLFYCYCWQLQYPLSACEKLISQYVRHWRVVSGMGAYESCVLLWKYEMLVLRLFDPDGGIW